LLLALILNYIDERKRTAKRNRYMLVKCLFKGLGDRGYYYSIIIWFKSTDVGVSWMILLIYISNLFLQKFAINFLKNKFKNLLSLRELNESFYLQNKKRNWTVATIQFRTWGNNLTTLIRSSLRWRKKVSNSFQLFNFHKTKKKYCMS